MFQTQHHYVSTDSDTISLLWVQIIFGAQLHDTAFQSVVPLLCLILSLFQTLSMRSGHCESQHHCISCVAKICNNQPYQWEDEARVTLKSLSMTCWSVWFRLVNRSTGLCCKCSHCKVRGYVLTE